MDSLPGRGVLGKTTSWPRTQGGWAPTLIRMEHLMMLQYGWWPTYQPEVVLQHLKRDHGCVSHTTEAAFLGTCGKRAQRRKIGLSLLNRDDQDAIQATMKQDTCGRIGADIWPRSIRVTLTLLYWLLNSSCPRELESSTVDSYFLQEGPLTILAIISRTSRVQLHPGSYACWLAPGLRASLFISKSCHR